MISGKNIICFGSEKWEYTGFQQTLMRKLSESNRILFVNPLGSRKIRLEPLQFKIYLQKVKSILAKSYAPETNALVCSPRIIPIVYNGMVLKLNKILARYQFSRLLSKINFNSYTLWIGTPTAFFLMDLFDPEKVVYHAVDRYSEFTFVDREKILSYERAVAKRADVILCTSDAIQRDLVKYNPCAFTITHAVEFDHFYSAMNGCDIPEDLKGINGPIIGYFGGLAERVNYSLIKKIALRFRDASIVLIGKKQHSLGEIESLPNVYLLGQKRYEELPVYLKHFSVCLIPYHVNSLMNAVDPIKLREYFCLGKPVVSVNLPEVRKYDELVYIGMDEESFVRKVQEAIEENDASLYEQRVQVAKESDWGTKIQQISKVVFGNSIQAISK